MRMIGQLPTRKSLHDRTVGWSWILFAVSWPWHLVGGEFAAAITRVAGGDFGAGTDVPRGVYTLLYAWMIAPLVASIVVGVNGWLKHHHAAALVPATLSMVSLVAITIFGFEEFWG
jgi:hypothetical protein